MVNKQKQSVPKWPREQLLRHGPELPMAERVARYQHNIRTIRAAGCTVPTVAMVDSLDPAVIEAWLNDGTRIAAALVVVIGKLAKLPDNTEVPSPFAGARK